MIEDETRVNGRNCITFTPRTNQATYVRIIRGKGCYSPVGKKALPGAQDLSIGDGCAEPKIVAHELIHALGEKLLIYRYLSCLNRVSLH